MKTTLEFSLPDEREELEEALNGSKNKMLIDTLYDQVFRPHIKYEKPLLPRDENYMQPLTKEQLDVIEQIWHNVQRHFSND